MHYWHDPYELSNMETDLMRIHRKGYRVWLADQYGCILKRSKKQITYRISKRTITGKTKFFCHDEFNVGLWKIRVIAGTGQLVQYDKQKLESGDQSIVFAQAKRNIILHLSATWIILRSIGWQLTGENVLEIAFNIISLLYLVLNTIRMSIHLQWLQNSEKQSRTRSISD